MGLVNSISETNEKAAEVSEKYIKSSYEYYKLKIFQQLTISASMVFKALIIGGLAVMFMLLSAIALAISIGESLENYPVGFLIVGAIFLAFSIIAFLFKDVINRMVVKKLSKNFFN